jgi:hypothetical protein
MYEELSRAITVARDRLLWFLKKRMLGIIFRDFEIQQLRFSGPRRV